MTKESVQMTVIRYRDVEGNPTCAMNFETGDVCGFYRTQRFGTFETCVFAPNAGHSGYTEQLNRRKDGVGTLIPGAWCPIWKEEL